jgi:hypothetical protein
MEVDEIIIEDPGVEPAPEPATDPGEQEGRPVAEKKAIGPNPRSERWNKMYKEGKENERKVGELTGQLAEQGKDVAAMREHNETLAGQINDINSRQVEVEASKAESDIEALTLERDTAYDKGELKEAARIGDKIQALRAKPTPPAPAPKPKERKTTEQAVAEQAVEVAVATFKQDTPWFDSASDKYDPMMAGAAQAVDAQLVNDPEWKGKPVAVILTEVRRRVEEKFKVTPNVPSVGGVESGGAGAVAGGTVTLSQEQVRAARMLFPDDPEAEIKYSEQLQFSKGGKA